MQEEHYVEHTRKSYIFLPKKKKPVIDYVIRNDILIKYDPFKIILFQDKYDKSNTFAYLFYQNGKIIVVLEEEKGCNYTKILILNKNDDIIEKIKDIIYCDKEKDIIRFGYIDSYTYEKNLNIIFNKKDNLKSNFKRGRNYQF